MKGIQQGLKTLLSHPFLLPGAGVTEFLLSQFIRERYTKDERIPKILNNITREVSFVIQSLETLSKTISQNHATTGNQFQLLEEYTEEMKKLNESFLRHTTFPVAARTSRHMSQQIIMNKCLQCELFTLTSSGGSGRCVMSYTVEPSLKPSMHATSNNSFIKFTLLPVKHFNPSEKVHHELQNTIVDIALAKQEAIQSSLQCFSTLMQSSK